MVRHAIVAFTVTCRGYRERVLAGALRGPQARRRRLSAAIPRPPFATAQFCPNVVVTYRPVPIRSGLVAALLVLAGGILDGIFGVLRLARGSRPAYAPEPY